MQRWTEAAVAGLVLAAITVAIVSPIHGQKRDEFLIGIARPPMEEAALRLVREAGANSFRRTLEWSVARGPSGRLQIPEEFRAGIAKGRQLGLEPVVVLSYGHKAFDGGGFPQSEAALCAFGDFASYAVGSLHTQVKYWELWNEWNRGTGMSERGAPESYVRFLQKVAPAVRMADGAARIWGGSMEGIGRANGWTLTACRAGMMGSLDALTFHPYCYFLPAGERMPERGLMELVQELEGTIHPFEHGTTIPIYITELGWPTHEGEDGVTLQEQANFTARALLLLRAHPRVHGVWIYTLFDREGASTDPESHFGLLFPDGTPKPAWHAFRDTALLLRNVTGCQPLHFSGDEAYSLAGVTLRRSESLGAVVVWAVDPGEAWKVVLRWPRRSAFAPKVTVRSVGKTGAMPLAVTVRGAGEICEITVTDCPLVVEGTGPGAVVDRVEMR